MNYKLSSDEKTVKNLSAKEELKLLYSFTKNSLSSVIIAFILLLANSLTVVIAPFIIGDVTNKYIPIGDRGNLIKWLFILAFIYIIGALFSYFQTRLMGKVGQTILFRIRNAIFNKIQSLPVDFFNQNKSGDLISRINNDTDKMNTAFSETILRFAGDIVVIIGIGVVMLILNSKLGLIAWITLGIMLFITLVLSNWIKKKNDQNLQKLGDLSAEIQESLTNFKVTVVFNRRDYFKTSFSKVNEKNKRAATLSSIANSLLSPIYTYAGGIGSLLIIIFGIRFLIIDKISAGNLPEIGTLLTFILYSTSFFNPLKELAEIFTQIQTAIASWSRIYQLLSLKNNLNILQNSEIKFENVLMKFNNVSFGYNKEKMVLNNLNMELEKGKTYALVGPTGGGKSTTASLMARLYDVSEGEIYYKSKDIRTYDKEQLTSDIGFILQEAFLFTGSLGENIKYGNDNLKDLTDEQLKQILKDLELEKIIERFNDGLQTQISAGAENISLGQRQLIAFVRILLRRPKLLILDEATANIDTVTEKILEEILNKLSKDTTKVIIAHRLNTIENADQIFFISGGSIEKPMDFNSALELINSSNNVS